jgi:hypothetical protein
LTTGAAGRVFVAMHSPAAVLDALRRTPDIVVPLVPAVPAGILKRRPAPVIQPYLPGDQDADDLLMRMDLDVSLDWYVADRAR